MKISDIRNQLAYRNTAPHRAINSIKCIVVHHDAVEAPAEYNPIERYKGEARFHYNKDWNGDGKPDGSGLMYHYKIDRKGNIYLCRNLGEALWHCGNYTKNLQSIAICLDGHLTNQKPTKAQLQSLKDFLFGLCTQHPEFPAGFSNVFGHREISATNCPGDNLIKFVQDFRNKKGQVNVDNYPQETEENLSEPTACEAERKEIRNLTKELKNSQSIQKRMGESLKLIGAELEDKKKGLSKSQRELKTANETIATKDEEIKKLKRRITTKDDRIAELKKERNAYRGRYEDKLETDVTAMPYRKMIPAILKREQERIKLLLGKLLNKTARNG